MNKRILITGASGLLGGNLCYLFHNEGYDVVGVYNNRAIDIQEIELISVTELDSYDKEVDIIIHCAAKTDVDACEKDPKDAYNINVGLTEKVIKIANQKNAVLLHISTDAVYKESIESKKEGSALEPLSVYARTKLDAENRIQERANQFSIIRTNLFGYNILNKNSLGEWVYNNLRANQVINGFCDVFFSPILVNDLFGALKQVSENFQISPNSIINIGSANGISKYDFACLIADEFNLDKNLIKKTLIQDYGFFAKRSKNSVMDCSYFEILHKQKLPTIEESVKNFSYLFNVGYPNHLKLFNKTPNHVKR